MHTSMFICIRWQAESKMTLGAAYDEVGEQVRENEAWPIDNHSFY